MPKPIIPGFKGDLVTSTDDEYEALLQRWSKNSIRPATLIACVKDENDVQLILAYAKDHNMEVVVKCGGHSAAGGASSTGIVIDLSKHMNKFEIDADKQTVRVDGGCRFQPIEEAALEKGLMIPAGTVNDTGIGGLTLGGGMGWLTGEHGMIIDSLLEATVVTGTGEIIRTSGDDDLFWAIRGGGAGSGVVTSMTFKLHKQQRDVFWGVMSMEPEQLPAVIRFVNKLSAQDMNPKSAVYIKLWAKKPYVTVQPFFNGSEEEGRTVLKELLAMPTITDTTGAVKYTDMTTVPYLCTTHNNNCGGVMYPSISEETAVAVLERMMSIAEDPEWAPTYLTIEFMCKDKMVAVPRDATAFWHRNLGSGSAINIRWDGVNNQDKERRGKAHRDYLTDLLESAGKANGYANYDSVIVSREEQMYGGNWQRLKEIRAKYDPDGIFLRKA